MIAPSPGRIVWYTPTKLDISSGLTVDPNGKKLAAIVCWVWGDRMVNLSVVNTSGVHFPKTSVTLAQDGDPVSDDGGYCQWMPFQLGQAKAR